MTLLGQNNIDSPIKNKKKEENVELSERKVKKIENM